MKVIDGLRIPENEDDIIKLIHEARDNGKKLRVRGSMHSVPASIFTDDFTTPPPGDTDINIYLSEFDQIEIFSQDGDNFVRAQAGVHLGHDPKDPAQKAKLENSLFYQLNEQGFALPDSGGIIHQTVGGFLATGSAGGSVKFPLGRAIEEFRFIDGNGEIHVANREKAPDLFNAIGVSMGLLGIITEVTFRLQPNFTVKGKETVYSYETVPIDVFGEDDSKMSLMEFFETTDHARIYWYPQKGVERFTVWEAYVDQQPAPEVWLNQRKPYEEFPAVTTLLGRSLLKQEEPAQWIASKLFNFVNPLNYPRPKSFPQSWGYAFLEKFFPVVLKAFISGEMHKPQEFYDIWYHALPMDNAINYDLLPVEFTELWIKRENVYPALRELRKYYDERGFEATGIEPVELYASPNMPFWLSPAYGDSEADYVVKIDAFWFGGDPHYPQDHFFVEMWERLRQFEYRPHWGKIQTIEPDYLAPLYPKWNDFMSMRNELDPKQIFVTDYWRKRMDIFLPQD